MDLIIPRSSVWGHQHQAPANDRPPAQVELSPNPLQALCFWRHGRRVPAPELRRRPQTASIGPCALRQRTSSASSIALRHIPAAARSRRSPLRRKGETSELSKKNHVVPRSFRRSGEIASRPSTACNRGLVLDLIGFVAGRARRGGWARPRGETTSRPFSTRLTWTARLVRGAGGWGSGTGSGPRRGW